MRVFRGKRTGKRVEIEEIPISSMVLMPPLPHLCQECAEDHPPEYPHNAQSLYYQTKFHMEHGRAATWADAMAHCPDDIKEIAAETLRERGIEVYQA